MSSIRFEQGNNPGVQPSSICDANKGPSKGAPLDNVELPGLDSNDTNQRLLAEVDMPSVHNNDRKEKDQPQTSHARTDQLFGNDTRRTPRNIMISVNNVS